MKTIFISDIHMGDGRSMLDPNPYVWFKNNIPLLAQFLSAQLAAPDVQEVVILGDLFDRWIIPADIDPLTSFDDICSNGANGDVIKALVAFAGSPNTKLTYVPGNHDMPLDTTDMATTKTFMQTTFPGINFIGGGAYRAGPLIAEHGHRYCLFNAPDSQSNSSASFLPLGYFISRMVAYKVSETGQKQDEVDIFAGIVEEYLNGGPSFAQNVFLSIARDCRLNPGNVNVYSLPGYLGHITIEDIGVRFSGITSTWGSVHARESVSTAVLSDQGDLSSAASSTYFGSGSDVKVVIFGHTHTPILVPDIPGFPGASNTIYTNTGAWVDSARQGCTYVETEVADGNLHVRLKGYQGDTPNPPKAFIKDEGYVQVP
ncbi:MAG: metallophosphoesterase [Syntrophobacteraceae bacterium]